MTAPTFCAVASCDHEPGADGVLCDRDRRRVEELLDDGLALLYVELHLAARERRRVVGDVVVAGSREKSLPLGAEQRACQERALELTRDAEGALRRAAGWFGTPRRGREGPTLQGSCRVLAAHLDELLRLEEGAVFADRLVRLAHRSEVALGVRGPQKSRAESPCPSCGRFSVVRHNGTDRLDCGSCGAVVDVEHVDKWLAA